MCVGARVIPRACSLLLADGQVDIMFPAVDVLAGCPLAALGRFPGSHLLA